MGDFRGLYTPSDFTFKSITSIPQVFMILIVGSTSVATV